MWPDPLPGCIHSLCHPLYERGMLWCGVGGLNDLYIPRPTTRTYIIQVCRKYYRTRLTPTTEAHTHKELNAFITLIWLLLKTFFKRSNALKTEVGQYIKYVYDWEKAIKKTQNRCKYKLVENINIYTLTHWLRATQMTHTQRLWSLC